MVWPKLLLVRLNQLKSRNLKNTISLEYKVSQRTRRDIKMCSSPETKSYPSGSKLEAKILKIVSADDANEQQRNVIKRILTWVCCFLNTLSMICSWNTLCIFNEILALCKNGTTVVMNCAVTYLKIRGRVDDLSFFEDVSPFCFLSIEIHCTFSISYKILPYFIYYYCILVRMW